MAVAGASLALPRPLGSDYFCRIQLGKSLCGKPADHLDSELFYGQKDARKAIFFRVNSVLFLDRKFNFPHSK